jgi:hypothetical protein
MLSPHEFATLMLVNDARDPDDLNGADLDALLERQLVTLEKLTAGRQHLRLTEVGHLILNAVSRIH